MEGGLKGKNSWLIYSLSTNIYFYEFIFFDWSVKLRQLEKPIIMISDIKINGDFFISLIQMSNFVVTLWEKKHDWKKNFTKND